MEIYSESNLLSAPGIARRLWMFIIISCSCIASNIRDAESLAMKGMVRLRPIDKREGFAWCDSQPPLQGWEMSRSRRIERCNMFGPVGLSAMEIFHGWSIRWSKGPTFFVSLSTCSVWLLSYRPILRTRTERLQQQLMGWRVTTSLRLSMFLDYRFGGSRWWTNLRMRWWSCSGRLSQPGDSHWATASTWKM